MFQQQAGVQGAFRARRDYAGANGASITISQALSVPGDFNVLDYYQVLTATNGSLTYRWRSSLGILQYADMPTIGDYKLLYKQLNNSYVDAASGVRVSWSEYSGW